MVPTLYAPVLVLNANFEPINVCNVRRAVGLMMDNRASLVMNGRGNIYSINQAIPIPSIIRLDRMVRRPRPRVKLCKEEIFRRDLDTCQYCGRKITSPTLDHVVPKHLGGSHTWHNLVTACSTCNHRKGGRRLEQVHEMRLLREPFTPPPSAQYLFGKYLSIHQEWLPYIDGW